VVDDGTRERLCLVADLDFGPPLDPRVGHSGAPARSADGDVSDNGTYRGFDIGRHLALGIQEGAEQLREIVGPYIEADRHDK